MAVAGGTGLVGHHVVAAARAGGHDVVVCSRSTGADVATGAGLAAALQGAEVLVDVLNTRTREPDATTDFFVTAAGNLQRAGAEAGVGHLVLLSILGVDRVPGHAYYRAKVAHEHAASAGPLPVTVLRAAQFHEFAGLMVAVRRRGPVALVPRIASQPVAARTVAEHLVRLAGSRPGGVQELAGPEVHDVADLARRLVAARGARVHVVGFPVPGRAGRAMRRGALLAGPTTTIDGPSFADWLATDDARTLPLRRPAPAAAS